MSNELRSPGTYVKVMRYTISDNSAAVTRLPNFLFECFQIILLRVSKRLSLPPNLDRYHFNFRLTHFLPKLRAGTFKVMSIYTPHCHVVISSLSPV